MRITVLFFAHARERAGRPHQTFELPDGATLADLRRLVVEAHPALGPLLPTLAVAVDGALARDGAEITDGAEVALLPPVSGG